MEEVKEFNSGKGCISFNAFLYAQDFELSIEDIFLNKEERELATALVNRNIKIKLPDPRKREADILLPEFNSQIEVTKILPHKIRSKNNAHGEGAHINARFCEGFVRTMRMGVNKFFVVFHKDWEQYGWLKKLSNQLKPSVISLSTNFESGWENQVAEEISQKLNQ